MPVSSLPSPYGIGAFSKEAYEFVDFLAEAGQTYWQMLPLGQTGYGDSPYQSFSTFAGNPYFIDLDQLVEAGYLEAGELAAADFGADSEHVSYDKIYSERFRILRMAYHNSHMHCRSQSAGRDIRKRRRRLKHLLKSMRHGCRTMHFTVRSRMHLAVRA